MRQLTDVQRSVLQLSADGLMAKQIAHKLGLSVRTIEMYSYNLRHKLKAKNISHAVAIGLRTGAIS